MHTSCVQGINFLDGCCSQASTSRVNRTHRNRKATTRSMWLKTRGAGRLSMPIAINRDRFPGIDPGIRGELLCASLHLEDVQNGCAARCSGDLHKSEKYHVAKLIAARRHCAKSGTSDSLPKSSESFGAEPSAAAVGTGSASVESTTSLARASMGTCGGVPSQLTGNAQKQALGRRASRRH